MLSGIISCFHEVGDKLPNSKIDAVELAMFLTVVAVRWRNITEGSVPSLYYQSIIWLH